MINRLKCLISIVLCLMGAWRNIIEGIIVGLYSAGGRVDLFL